MRGVFRGSTFSVNQRTCLTSGADHHNCGGLVEGEGKTRRPPFSRFCETIYVKVQAANLHTGNTVKVFHEKVDLSGNITYSN
jgi:hypothetical protein